MRKIKEYMLVSESYSSNVETQVNVKLGEGWSLFGGVVASNNNFAQALVKYEEELDQEKPCHNYTE